MANVEALSCPVCGGRVDFEEGAQRGQCRSCRASLALPAAMGYYHYYVDPAVRRNTALTIAAMATELAVESIAAHLSFVPVWSVRAETFGFIAGQRPIKDLPIMPSDDVPLPLPEVPPGRRVGGEVVKKSLWLAQEFREFGVRWSGLSGLKIEKVLAQPQLPLAGDALANLGIMLEPHDLPPERALAAARNYFRGHMLFPYGDYPILHSTVANLRIDPRLVYYPVWSVWGFTRLGRFKCTVDAVTGDRISSWQYQRPRPPQPTKYLLAATVLLLALSMFYAPTSGYSMAVLIGTLALAAGVLGGIYLKKHLADRMIDKACRAIWGM